MTEPKSKLQFWRSPPKRPSLGLDPDELTQQVEIAADDAFADEPTLVGLDFDETRKPPK